LTNWVFAIYNIDVSGNINQALWTDSNSENARQNARLWFQRTR